MMKNLKMQNITDNHVVGAQKKKDMYTPILQKIKYWRDYTGTGDTYRQEHDRDCILTGGNLFSDTLFSLWLPLRYTLNYYGCELWNDWKEFEDEKLRPQKLGLKDCPDFLNSLIENIDAYLPPTRLTTLLSELFQLGQQRCNVMILPYRSWNSRRGCNPYWEYLPHFLYDLMNTDSAPFLQAISAWLKTEHLEMFFNNGNLDKNNLKDLAGTGAVWRHKPSEINLEHLLHSYIDILKERQAIINDVA